MSKSICDKPPEGWICSRENGHKGPCAAYEELEYIDTKVLKNDGFSADRNLMFNEIEAILHLDGCQQRTAGYNEAKSGKELDYQDMEKKEVETFIEIKRILKKYEISVRYHEAVAAHLASTGDNIHPPSEKTKYIIKRCRDLYTALRGKI